MPHFAVILPAAGKAARFGGEKNKLLYELDGATVLRRSIAAFTTRKDVAIILVATSDELMLAQIDGIQDSRIETRAGGASRAHSVLAALRLVPQEVEWVGVHDAARPLVSQGLIDRVLAAAVEHGAAAPAMAVTSTIKEAAGPLPARVERTVPRETLWALQTPQIMRREALARAYEKCTIPLEQVTDDVQLLELMGQDVWLVAGEERNIKITTPVDLRVAETMLRET